MAVFLPFLAYLYDVEEHFRGWKKFLLPFVYPVAVIVATPSYVAYICFIACRRIIDTEYQPENGRLKGQLPGFLKFSEITLESETQLILGECKTLIE